MAYITVSETPRSFAIMSGLDGTRNTTVFHGVVFNTGATINYIRRANAPQRDEPAIKILRNTQTPLTVYPDSHGATWLWTVQGESQLVYVFGSPGE